MSEYKLTGEIIALSASDNWDLAKLEWELDDVYRVGEGNPETCLCGKHPIFKVCVLLNLHNHAQAKVGNCCVKKFIGLPSEKIFNCIEKIQKDRKKSLNIETIEHAHKKGWINDWERKFSIDTIRKTAFSDKQWACRTKINNKVIRHMSK